MAITILDSERHYGDNYDKHPPGSIMTYTGRMVQPTKLNPEDVCIEDIAHALSNECRYGGHVKKFFSVAQHCVIVSNIVPEHLALAGLLHDAAEAYFKDMPRPLKHEVEMTWYRQKEDNTKVLIWNLFLKDPPVLLDDLDAIIKADVISLRTEQKDLMPWHNSYPEYELDMVVSPLLPESAESLFLARYEELKLIYGKA